MKFIFVLFLIFTSTFIKSQRIEYDEYEFIQSIFQESNLKSEYNTYQNKIIEIDSNEFHFGERVIYLEPKNNFILYKLIRSGIFNPDEIFGKELIKIDTIEKLQDGHSISIEKYDSVLICCISELIKNNPDHKTKRFHLLVITTDILNPFEYYIELRNEYAIKETSIEEFIENSKLTFVYNAGLML